MIASTSANAECFIVTDLSTPWQRKLSWVLNNTDRQNIEYKITIKDGHVQIEPGSLECALLNTSNLSGSIEILCGKDVFIEKSASNNHTKSSDFGVNTELSKIKGTVMESWSLHKELGNSGIAIVTVYNGNGKAKTYTGILKTVC